MAYKAIKLDGKQVGSAEYFNALWDNAIMHDKDGNKKLEVTEDTIYYIWNLPVYVTCPYATENCKKACYAEEPEKNYCMSAVLKARYDNLALCTGDNADTFVYVMTARLEKLFNSKKYKARKNIRVRIHESGDFFSKAYVKMWLEIAMYFNKPEYSNVVFMAYTKSLPFFIGEYIPENFVLRFSVWDDTPSDMITLARGNGFPIYTAIPASLENYAIEKGFIKCDCENCSTCEKHCFTSDNKNIYVLLHGRDSKKLENDIDTLKQIIDYFA